MFTNKKIDSELNKKLSLLKEVPERRAEDVAKGRSAFLKEAHHYKVSGVIGQRQLNQPKKSIPVKPALLNWRPKMLKVAIPIILAFVIVFGTGWMVVRASQGSQPNQLLYSVKLASEELALSMAANPADQFDLSSAYMQNRATEIIVLFNKGESPSEEEIQRFVAQVDNSIAIAAGMDDEQAKQALGRIQTRLETQIQAIKLLKVDSLSEAEKSREKILLALQDKLDIVIKGKVNLTWLREKIEESHSKNNSNESQSPTPTLISSTDSHMEPTATSIHGNSQATHTHTPGAGNNQGGGNSGNSEKTKTPPGNSQGGKKTPTSIPAPTDEDTSATATPKKVKNK